MCMCDVVNNPCAVCRAKRELIEQNMPTWTTVLMEALGALCLVILLAFAILAAVALQP